MSPRFVKLLPFYAGQVDISQLVCWKAYVSRKMGKMGIEFTFKNHSFEVFRGFPDADSKDYKESYADLTKVVDKLYDEIDIYQREIEDSQNKES